MNKMQLEILIKLPTRQFNAVIKLLNNKVTDKDLEPMFPKGWDADNKWAEIDRYDYDSFRQTQIEIDLMYEKMAGC